MRLSSKGNSPNHFCDIPHTKRTLQTNAMEVAYNEKPYETIYEHGSSSRPANLSILASEENI